VRKGIVISLAAHALAILIAFASVSFRQVRYVPRDAYRVRLVTAATAASSAPARPTPPVPEPKTSPPPEKPLRKDDLAPPVEKPKPKTRPAEEETKEVPRAQVTKGADEQPASGDTLASAPPAATGEVSFDGGDFPYDAFVARMRQKIAAAWQVPAGSEGSERLAVVYFRVHRDGSVSQVAVENRSGLFLFDQSCQRAVLRAAPLPPLPREYVGDYVGVHFTFKYVPVQSP
jgi:TonB family protein